MSLVRELPFLQRISPGNYRDRRTGIIYRGRKEVIESLYNDFPIHIRRQINCVPLEIREILEEQKISFISTKRLSEMKNEIYDEGKNNNEGIINNYAFELKERLNKALTEYINLSQKLDEEFPSKVLSTLSSNTFEKVELSAISKTEEEIQQLRSRLTETGILQDNRIKKVDINTKDINEYASAILKIYYEDMARKLHSLDHISQQVQRFTKMINRKFLSNKKIYVSPEHGFYFRQNESDCQNFENCDTWSDIPLKDLSSGEQHELLLLYELCFKLSANEIILIDEPEISLHVSWQRQFVDDILNIIHDLGAQVIIATHSPQIINEHWNQVVKLGEVG